MSQPPVCTIVAGPNGAGKTTFALAALPKLTGCRAFINADLIAAGLSPLAPEQASVSAGKLFFRAIEDQVASRRSFAFETTLSGRAWMGLARRLRADGWRIRLFYLWLPSVEMSRERVRERVRHGGHDIPDRDIERRYPKSLRHLLIDAPALCDEIVCLDNSSGEPNLIFTESSSGRSVLDTVLYHLLVTGVRP